MLSVEKINENYVLFLKKLEGVGVDYANIVKYVGENNLKNATFAINSDMGMAYDGSLINIILRKVTKYAVLINQMLPENVKVNEESLVKVCLLHQISKAIMFEENDSTWEKTNRGLLYKYSELEGSLRCGERSAYICLSNGVQFTPEEYEAMRIMDKDSEDTYAKFYSSPIATIVKQANELAAMDMRITNKKSK